MTKTKTNTKAMEKLSAMGITIEQATTGHVENVNANMSMERPELIEISHVINFKGRLLKACKMSATKVESIRIASNRKAGYHVNLIHTKMIGDYDSVVVFDTISGKTFDFVVLSVVDPHVEYFFKHYHRLTVISKKTTSKSDLIISSVNMCESIVKNNTVAKLPKYAECTVEKIKTESAEKAKKDYAKRIALNGTIADRKPEKANIYSCNGNTLEASIDYTKTDLKQLETLNGKKAKIENTLDAFELLEKSKIENEITAIKRKAVKRTSKNIQKCSNKSLKEITDNAREIMKHNAELTAAAKETTTKLEFVSMSRQFKKAFRNVVDIEHNENCRDVSAKLSALHEKQKALDEKRKAIKTKLSCCESVISQLTKTDTSKINYSLIDSKLDVIGISLTDYSLDEIQAVKASISDTYNKVISAIANTVDDIKALSDIETTYSKIKHGKEILIDITTKSLAKNIFFSVVVGYDIKENNSTYAILHIRQLTEKTLEKIGLNECVIDVNYNIFRNSDPDIKLALARQTTKRQAYNMIARQGSKTQYNIYHCAMRNDFDDHDTADIYSTAYTQILNCLFVKNAADIVTAKKVIIAVNSKIQHLNRYVDCHVIEKYVSAANKALKDVYKVEFVKATSDYNRNKSVITLLENMRTAISAKSVKALKTSCYNAINHYLTSIRAIREKSDIDSLDGVIESETDRFYTLFEDNQEVEYSEKSTILKMCYSAMKKCLNESAAKTFKLMSKGYSEVQISEKRKISKPAISEQITEIKQAFIKCYTDIKNNENNKELFKNNPIVFDPFVFDDCKTISEKSEKITATYQKNTEIDRIKKAVSEMPLTEYKCMKYNFKKFLDGFNTLQRQIYIKLLENNTSDRKIADLLEIKRDRVKDLREKIIKTIQTIIEEYTTITIDKTALKKTPMSVYVNFFAIA